VIPVELVSPLYTGFEVRVDGRDLLLRRPFSRTQGAAGREIRLPMGRQGRLGEARVFARPVVEATVEIRNAFGNSSETTQEIVLPFDIAAPKHAALEQHESELVR
jgi:hypothetical protein